MPPLGLGSPLCRRRRCGRWARIVDGGAVNRRLGLRGEGPGRGGPAIRAQLPSPHSRKRARANRANARRAGVSILVNPEWTKGRLRAAVSRGLAIFRSPMTRRSEIVDELATAFDCHGWPHTREDVAEVATNRSDCAPCPGRPRAQRRLYANGSLKKKWSAPWAYSRGDGAGTNEGS